MKSYLVSGYAVNKRGNTVGIHYVFKSTSDARAATEATQRAMAGGYRHILFTSVQGAVE